jgi:hypothetical protein
MDKIIESNNKYFIQPAVSNKATTVAYITKLIKDKINKKTAD